jgi:hypothetical protein
MEDSMGKSCENLENDGPLTQKVKVLRDTYGKIIKKSINGGIFQQTMFDY